MVLKVPLETLAHVMAQYGVAGPVFVAGMGGKSLISAADPEKGLLIQVESKMVAKDVKTWLTENGISALNGCWSADGSETLNPATSFWIAAIAYRAHDGKPGLWVDALAFKPTASEVLSSMFEEFRTSGELEGMTIEEFIERADPNVVILDPDEQARFAAEVPCP